MDKDDLRNAFMQAAIEAHVGFQHPRPWADCDFAICDERKRLIGSPAAATTTAPVEQSGDLISRAEAAKHVCFRCKKSAVYSPAEQTSVTVEGNERVHVAGSWIHRDRGGSVFVCHAAELWTLPAHVASVESSTQARALRNTPNLTDVIEKVRSMYSEFGQTASRYFAEKDLPMEQYFSAKATAVSEVLTLLAPFIKTECEYCNDADGYSVAEPHEGEQWIHRRRQTGEMFLCRANHNYDCPRCGGDYGRAVCLC